MQSYIGKEVGLWARLSGVDHRFLSSFWLNGICHAKALWRDCPVPRGEAFLGRACGVSATRDSRLAPSACSPAFLQSHRWVSLGGHGIPQATSPAASLSEPYVTQWLLDALVAKAIFILYVGAGSCSLGICFYAATYRCK